MTKINWFGLVGGIAVILLIIISLFIPWWQLTVGDNLIKANMSPLNTNFSFVGESFTIPLIWALNIASIISLAAGGIVILIYSVMPTKSYSKRLLGFAYRKPLYSLLFFIIGLMIITLLVKAVFNLNVPMVGSTKATLPSSLTQGVTASVLMSAEFHLPFWLAVVTAGLCIAARLYHKKIAPPAQAPPAPATPPTTTNA